MMLHNKDITIKTLMLFIDAKFPTAGLKTELDRKRYLNIMSGLIDEIEIAMTAVKDIDE